MIDPLSASNLGGIAPTGAATFVNPGLAAWRHLYRHQTLDYGSAVPSEPATTPPSFPVLAGQGWSVHKKPTLSTIVASHASGREVRSPLYQYPLWEFEATFDGLDSAGSFPGLGAQSLQTLMGFYLSSQGQFNTFLYNDPTDNSVTGQTIGTADGQQSVWPFVRTLGGFTEPVGWATTISNVYLNGVSQASGWRRVHPNSLVFANPPPNGDLITADFSYNFLCRFLDDSEDFDQFMSGLWQVASLKFSSVRTS